MNADAKEPRPLDQHLPDGSPAVATTAVAARQPCFPPLQPGARVGILGGGQLGRMLAVAAARLGLTAHIYSDVTGPAFDVSASQHIGAFDDIAAIKAFASTVDVVTYEFENVPVAAAVAAHELAPVRPGSLALEVAQDRRREKQFIANLGLPVAPFVAVASAHDLSAALVTLGSNAILKTAQLGYDGKGQIRLHAAPDPVAMFEAIGSRPAVLEQLVAFQYEISVLICRGGDGTCKFYDIPRNTHRDGILDTSSVPSGLPPKVAAEARTAAQNIAEALDYVGVLAVEMFYVGAGDDTKAPSASALVVNEIAPRVHNSGHWTLDACAVSQFENHIRAICGWPLGDTSRHSDATMVNLIGEDIDEWPRLAADTQTGLHIYGKNQARPGRKMGHITRLTAKSAG